MPVDLSVTLRIAFLEAAMAAQREEEDKIKTYRDFWDGDQSVILTDRQKEYLTKTVDSFANICRRVINVPKDRLDLIADGISGQDDESQAYADKATEWWQTANADSSGDDINTMQKEVYEASLRDGNVGVIVGWDTEMGAPTFTPNLVYDGATGQLRFHYDSNNKLVFVSKRWTTWDPIRPGATGKRRLTVYRPDVIERYEADSNQPSGWRFLMPEEIGLPNPHIWTDDGTLEGEPLGIPVIPFENPGGSELADVINIQELLNHNLGTMDISIDYHGFPLLWFRNLELDTDSSTGKKLMPTFQPGQGFALTDGGEAGRIEPADLLKMFESGVLSWIQILAIVKGWPMFVFNTSGQPPSGVALKVLESGLVSQVQDKQKIFGGAWQRCFDMARKLHQIETGEELPGRLKFSWRSAQTSDKLADFEALKVKFEAGQVPTIQRWRELGYTAAQIAQMMEDADNQDRFGFGALGEIEQ